MGLLLGETSRSRRSSSKQQQRLSELESVIDEVSGTPVEYATAVLSDFNGWLSAESGLQKEKCVHVFKCVRVFFRVSMVSVAWPVDQCSL